MKFSTGMFQRLGIARAFIKQPDVLLLDEPSRSLDPQASDDLHRIIRNAAASGTAVLVTTHNLEEVLGIADRVGILCKGSLLAERTLAPGEAHEELREFYFRNVTGAVAEPERSRQ
jgi:ABC-type multidrug transport system ATPase subunit